MKTVQPAVTSGDFVSVGALAAGALGGVTPQHTAVRLRSQQVQREKGSLMQTMALDERLDRRPRPDHQVHHRGDPAAVSAGTPQLVARAGTGDQVAWDQLVQRYGAMVWAIAREADRMHRLRGHEVPTRG